MAKRAFRLWLVNSSTTSAPAIEALRKEGRALADVGTWDESAVQELDNLLQEPRRTGERIHIGQLLGICSIKYWEMTAALHVYKGRWCFQAPETRDERGSYALFHELHSKPTTVTACNVCIFYSMLPGNKVTTADAVRAYVQALLKSKHRTFVKLPRSLWPAEWEGKYKNPVVLLLRALYGHPEAGAHWEDHLTNVLKDLGGAPVYTHPLTFWFESTKLLLTVYVDDLMLAGPEAEHEGFWTRLLENVKLEDPEPLTRFLGRHHEFQEISAPEVDIRDYFVPEEKVKDENVVEQWGLD